MPRLSRAAGLAAPAALITVAVALASAPAPAQDAAPASEDGRFSFIALGDMPYATPEDYQRFDRLIARVNELAPAFSVHVGDTKSGGSECSDARLQATLDQLMTFEQPLIYTPGDNEWTDCHRAAAGGYDPLERLERVRAMHFSEAQSLGASPMPVTRQADQGSHPQMVENQRWRHGGVVFATVHVVGSNNGFERTQASVEEYFARNQANLDWIAEAFEAAAADDVHGLVVAFQANPLFEERHDGASGFADTISAFREGALALGKPVLLVHGDFHVLLIDQPLKTDDLATIETVYRLQVMGASEVQAVEVTVDPAWPGLFAFRPVIVPANVLNPPS